MRIHHIKMPLVHWHITRFYNHQPTVMQRVQPIGQLHQIFKIGNRAIAPPVLSIMHKGCAINRRKKTVLRLPMRTDFAGLRANCSNSDGAVRHRRRARPSGNRTRVPFTSAPPAARISSAIGSSRNSSPTSFRSQSAWFSSLTSPLHRETRNKVFCG